LVSVDGNSFSVDRNLVSVDGNSFSVDRNLVSVDGNSFSVDGNLVSVDGNSFSVFNIFQKNKNIFFYFLNIPYLCTPKLFIIN
jgi:hypothetical protein